MSLDSSKSGDLVGAGRISVAPERLADELHRIRMEAARLDAEREAAITGSAAPRVRATMANLIIVAGGDAEVLGDRIIDELMEQLCVVHPSRFFVISLASGHKELSHKTDSCLETWVSSRCVLARSGAHVCSEEVYVAVAEEAIPGLKSVLLSLMIPDVPSIILLLGDPLGTLDLGSDNRAFQGLVDLLVQLGDKVIFNSVLFADYNAGIRFLLQGRSSENGAPALSRASSVLFDLTWQHLRRWRLLVAEKFDDEELSSRKAADIKCLSLYYHPWVEGKPGWSIPPDTALLAAWFLNSLSWRIEEARRLEGEQGFRLYCSDGRRKGLTVDFLRREPEDRPEVPRHFLHGVSIEIERGDESRKISLRHPHEKQAAEVRSDLCPTLDGDHLLSVRQVSFDKEVLSGFSAADFSGSGNDSCYREALDSSLRIIAALVSESTAVGLPSS